MPTRPLPDLKSIQDAKQRIHARIGQTPVMTSRLLNQKSSAKLFFKCENLQKTGAFKFRGASNAVWSLPSDMAQFGVATHSSGNHGAALSLAAKHRGITAHVVVPENSVVSKVNAIKAYGGQVYFCEPTQAAREARLDEVLKSTGASPVHPYDDARTISGQGTAALELLEQVDQLDCIITPIGGGGLSSGTAIVAKSQHPPLKVYAAEPSGANDAARSLQQGSIIDDFSPNTICDGLRARLGVMNFAILDRFLDQIIEVDDDETLNAMRLIWHIMKMIIEPSCATVLAAVLKRPDLFENRSVGLILSGGNVDLDQLPWIKQ